MPDGTRTTGQILADLQSLGIVDPNEWLRELYGIPRSSGPAVKAAAITAAPPGGPAPAAPPGTIPQATRPTGLAPLPPARATTSPLETAISDAQTFLGEGGAGTSPAGPPGGPVSFAEGGRMSGAQRAALAALSQLSPVFALPTAIEGIGTVLGFGQSSGRSSVDIGALSSVPGMGVGITGGEFGSQSVESAAPPEGLGEFGGGDGGGPGGSPGAGGAAGGAGEGGVGEGAPHRGRLIRRSGWQRLEAGEYVVNREASKRFRSLLDALNELTPRYRPARRP